MSTVFCTSNQAKALVVKALLEDYEIPCSLSREAISVVYPTNINGLAEIQILVPEEYEKQALEILESHQVMVETEEKPKILEFPEKKRNLHTEYD